MNLRQSLDLLVVVVAVVFALVGVGVVDAQNQDLFNYGRGITSNTCDGGDCARPSFAQEFWQNIRCENTATCVSSILMIPGDSIRNQAKETLHQQLVSNTSI